MDRHRHFPSEVDDTMITILTSLVIHLNLPTWRCSEGPWKKAHWGPRGPNRETQSKQFENSHLAFLRCSFQSLPFICLPFSKGLCKDPFCLTTLVTTDSVAKYSTTACTRPVGARHPWETSWLQKIPWGFCKSQESLLINVLKATKLWNWNVFLTRKLFQCQGTFCSTEDDRVVPVHRMLLMSWPTCGKKVHKIRMWNTWSLGTMCETTAQTVGASPEWPKRKKVITRRMAKDVRCHRFVQKQHWNNSHLNRSGLIIAQSFANVFGPPQGNPTLHFRHKILQTIFLLHTIQWGLVKWFFTKCIHQWSMTM